MRFRLRHAWGGLALLFLLFALVSGTLLHAYYRPTTADAFYSIGIIMDGVRLGWLVRSVHAWSADLAILFSFLHLIRTYLAHAYETPRQLTWTTGVLGLLVLLAFAFTGDLLPWDQHGYWSTEVARQTIAQIPVAGSVLLSILWGGWAIGDQLLLRFYVFHIAILPWVVTAVVAVHLFLVWRFGMVETSRAATDSRSHATPWFPDFAVNLLIAVLLISGLLLTVATFFPPLVADRADPLIALPQVAPRWYFAPVSQLFRSLSAGNAALVVTGATLLLLSVPFFDGQPIRSRWRKLLRWGVGVFVIAGCLLWGMREYLS